MKKLICDKRIIKVFISLLISFVLLVGSLFAWFYSGEESFADAPELRIIDQEDNNFVIMTLNELSDYDDGIRYIWPNDVFVFELKAIKDEVNFAVGFKVERLTNEKFAAQIGSVASSGTNRLDLIRGPYEKQMNIAGTENKFFDFDIEKHFINSGYNNDQLHGYKLAFLKRFTDSNNIVSAFTARITKIIRADGTSTDCSIKLIRNAESDLILYPDPAEVQQFYGTSETNLEFNENDVITVEVTYGKRMLKPEPPGDTEIPWLPQMTIDSDEAAAYGGIYGSFRSYGLNCFIGQKVTIGFKSQN